MFVSIPPSSEQSNLDKCRQIINTLPNGICPDYAQSIGTCGTYSFANCEFDTRCCPKFYQARQGFMGALPQYSRSGFHVASESFGGQYGPIFKEYIEAQNAKKVSRAAAHLTRNYVDWALMLGIGDQVLVGERRWRRHKRKNGGCTAAPFRSSRVLP